MKVFDNGISVQIEFEATDLRVGGGGKEVPFRSKLGARLLLCWEPATGKHVYVNLDTDMPLSDDEARCHLI